MKQPNPYKRLPGRSKPYFGVPYLFELIFTFTLLAFGERCRLYRGPDHLLVLRRRLFAETAHRFYFSDIQAITIRRTLSAPLASMLLALSCVLTLSFMFIAPRFLPFNDATVYLMAVLGTAFALGLGYNILLGPTCITELYTPVHHERLVCLSRWRTAHRALTLLKPLITEAQGALEPGALLNALPEEPVLAAKHRPKGLHREQERATSSYAGGLHAALYGLFFGLVLSSLIDLMGDWNLKNAFDSVYFSLMLIVACIAVARQRHSTLPSDMKVLTVVALAASVLLFEATQAIVMGKSFMYMTPGKISVDFALILKNSETVRLTFTCVNIALYSVLGLLGMVAFLRFRRTARPAEEVAAVEPVNDAEN